ncbi:hypothetical protein IKN40_01145, partial [bacterium]|nr:hypothetical protein [bacterium]
SIQADSDTYIPITAANKHKILHMPYFTKLIFGDRDNSDNDKGDACGKLVAQKSHFHFPIEDRKAQNGFFIRT